MVTGADRSLFIQARSALKKVLQQHLRTQRAIRRSKHAGTKQDGHGQILNMVSIRKRPASVEGRDGVRDPVMPFTLQVCTPRSSDCTFDSKLLW